MGGMTLIIYPCGRGRGDLLRYSLRSLAAAAGPEVPEVLLIGDIPDYIDRTALHVRPMSQHSGKFVNVWRSWETAASLEPDRQWWWFNDDFIVTGALAETLVDTHRGSLQSFCEALARRTDVAVYRRRAEAALRLLRREDYADPLNWEAHTPLRAHAGLVEAAARLCERHDTDPSEAAVRTLIATIDGRTGLAVPDPKVEHPREHRLPYPLASPGPRAWHGSAGREVRERFPKPSPWERP
jgi:hypothetical protein